MYLDTSVLAAYYCPEPRSAEAQRLVLSADNPTISDLSEVELFSTLNRKVRSGDLLSVDASEIAATFRRHLEDALYRRLSLERRHFETASGWLAGFTVALRTLDALHLAVAATGRLQLATLDRALARAATSLGVRTVANDAL